MPLETGKRILEILEDMRFATTQHTVLPVYRLGNKGERFPPYLEDLIEGGEKLPLLYGRE
jgi:hypothetical protein